MAGFGIIFFTPMLVDAMLSGTADHLRSGGGGAGEADLRVSAEAAHADGTGETGHVLVGQKTWGRAGESGPCFCVCWCVAFDYGIC